MSVQARSLLSPSDLEDTTKRGPARLAGRVIGVEDPDGLSLTLADAFARARVILGAPSPVAVGDLLVVDGTLEDGVFKHARIVERICPARPPLTGLQPRDAAPGSESERLIARAAGSALRARAAGLAAIRDFFQARGFVEVDTPALVPSPGLDLHLDAFEVPDTRGPSFVDRRGYLITSPEYQMKRLLAGGVPRCFQLSRCYRKGEVGHRHNPEFLMLEWYRGFAGVGEVIDDTEALTRHVARALAGGDVLTIGGHRVDLSAPFERLSVGEAFARYAGVAADEAIDMASTDEDRFFRLLVDEVEPALEREPRPIFVVDYPAPFASLARLSPADPRVAERFELYLGGVELCNGFGELTCAREQRERLERDQRERARRGLSVYPIDERFLAALEEGMPPSAGNALGVDRLIALCLGLERIGDAQAFPVDWL